MNTENLYKHITQGLPEGLLTELQQLVMFHEVEKYREEIAGHLKHEVQDWIKAVCEAWATEMEMIHTPSRKREVVIPRQVIMWGLACGVVPNKLSFSAIGRMFTRDHATVMHAKKVVYQLADTDQEMRETIIKLVNHFGWTAGYDTETRSFYMHHPVYAVKKAA